MVPLMGVSWVGGSSWCMFRWIIELYSDLVRKKKGASFLENLVPRITMFNRWDPPLPPHHRSYWEKISGPSWLICWMDLVRSRAVTCHESYPLLDGKTFNNMLAIPLGSLLVRLAPTWWHLDYREGASKNWRQKKRIESVSSSWTQQLPSSPHLQRTLYEHITSSEPLLCSHFAALSLSLYTPTLFSSWTFSCSYSHWAFTSFLCKSMPSVPTSAFHKSGQRASCNLLLTASFSCLFSASLILADELVAFSLFRGVAAELGLGSFRILRFILAPL